jgi:hypothetical protein
MILISLAQADMTEPVIIKILEPESAWSGSELSRQMTVALTRRPNCRAIVVEGDRPDLPTFPTSHYDLDSLVNWGVEIGGRYLLLVDVHSRRLERRKGWHIPLILHRYRSVGVIEGELRLVDLAWKRTLVAEPFKLEEEAKMIMQASMDDNINDPEILLPATAKIQLFREMEQKLSEHILRRLDVATGGSQR